MNEVQNDVIKNNKRGLKAETPSKFSKVSKYKHTTQLGIWLLFLITWYNYSLNTSPYLIKEALPAIIIVSICLFIRSSTENHVIREK